jgi:CDP-ribitol ribitolphosphotransferase
VAEQNTPLPDAAPRITVSSVWWERVHLYLEVRIEAAGDVPRSFYLEARSTGERALLSDVMRSGSNLTIRANMMLPLDGYPITTGTWALFAGDPDEEPEVVEGAPWALDPEEDDGPEPMPRVGTPVDMAEGLSIDPATYGGLFTGRSFRYWVVPVTVPGSRQLALGVSYRPARGGARPGRSLRRRLRRAMRTVREKAYVGTYRATRALVRRNGRRILFTSDSRVEISGNLLHVYRRMSERGLDQTYQLHTIFKPSIKAKRSIPDKIRFPIYLGMADVVVMDDYQPMVYKVPFPDDVKVIQLWHASGAFKTVGYSRVGKPGGPTPFSRTHRLYTHAIVSSQHDVPFYAEAFGVTEDRVIPTGIPRMDMFFDDEAKTTAAERAYEAFPQAREKKTILFAPTFRGTGPATAYYDYDLLDLPALYRVCEQQNAMVIFKMHPFISEPMDIPAQYADRFVDATEAREVNDLLMIADLVITDYSSLVFEYSVLGGPMLFFAYDLEEYEAERDFYEPLVEFAPGKIVRTFPDLLEALRTEDFEQHKVAEFAREHFDHLDAGSSDRVIDDLILG